MLLLYFQTFDFLKHSSLSVLYVEAADDDVEQGDDEDNYLELLRSNNMKKQIIVISINVGNAYNFPHRSCVVQNVGCVLMFRIVDIKTAQYQEEDADQHLTNRPLLKKTLWHSTVFSYDF